VAPRSNHLAHVLICDPAKHRLYELFQRVSDGAWLSRTYSPIAEGDIDDAGKFGVQGLIDAGASRSTLQTVDRVDDLPGSLLIAITANQTTASRS
jgi:hypothetical protein